LPLVYAHPLAVVSHDVLAVDFCAIAVTSATTDDIASSRTVFGEEPVVALTARKGVYSGVTGPRAVDQHVVAPSARYDVGATAAVQDADGW
jgi:hypothetical protein